MTTWQRIESITHSIGLTGGLEARIADPLWMLARQRQVAEFRGDDAAQPAAALVSEQHTALNLFEGQTGGAQAIPEGIPLEVLAETTPGADFGAAGLFAAGRAARRLIHLLNAAGLDQAVGALRAAFPLQPPVRLVGLGNAALQAASLLARWGIDAAALASASPAELETALAGLPADQASQAQAILAAWITWYRGRDGENRSLAWDDERLEYSFTLKTGPAGGAATPAAALNAPEHRGGRLDWYAFDLTATSQDIKMQTRTHSALPLAVRYQGMPAGRWWQFEEGEVNFGDLEAGPNDLARLLVAEFATVYSRDWFVLPIRVPVGTLARIADLEVLDNFGGRTHIASTAALDARLSSARPWRLFELSGDPSGGQKRCPWLLIPPSLAADASGPALERVALARDEGANLAWGIENRVEGILGRAVDRAQAWYAAQPPSAPTRSETPPAPLSYADQSWRYALESTTPPWWIPFVAERIKPGSAEIRLRRARMQNWEQYSDENLAPQAGPQGLFLDPRRPLWIREEEVAEGGIYLERRWQFARWIDGSFHVWVQRRKSPGNGEPSSGLRWDELK